jgi:hypothetical protein
MAFEQWGMVLAILFIVFIKFVAKYLFYSQRDPRGVKRRVQEEGKDYKDERSGYQVTSIYIYPIKSCKGTLLQAAEIGRYGFNNDRRWMVVRQENNRFVTQRQLPKMALISPTLMNRSIAAHNNGKGATHLQVVAPDMPVLRIALPHINVKDTTRLETTYSSDYDITEVLLSSPT